jgi:N-acetylmuramoyl-L-alanine amidase
VLLEGQRREILPVVRDGAELVQIDLVLANLGVRMQSSVSEGTLTLSRPGREVSLYHNKSLAAVQGDLRLLSSPALLDGGRWLVPIDAIPKLLPPLLDKPASWRPVRRVLVIGNVPIPKVSVSNFVSGDTVRIVFEADESVPFQARQQQEQVTVAIATDVVDVEFRREDFTGGIVESVEFLGGKENLFAVRLGPRFQQVKAYEQSEPSRLVLEFKAAPVEAGAAAATAAPRPTPRRQVAVPARVGTVVIDPGHGGEDTGAKGPGGVLEKDVSLSIARRLRDAIIDRLGLQVFLTRNGDTDVPLDERAAIANNYKADLFISVHANASRSLQASGSEVYFLSYQATDDESRRVALLEGASLPEVSGPAGSDLAFILWDMAQAEYLEESSALASRLQGELAAMAGSEERGVKQAPFRVLVGAAMPAVLVEVAFISNPEEEKLLESSAYQQRVGAALMRGIARYRTDRVRRVRAGMRPERPGS